MAVYGFPVRSSDAGATRRRLDYRERDGLGSLQIRGAIPSKLWEKARPIFKSQFWSDTIESKTLRDLAYSLTKLDQACIYSIQAMRTDELFRIRDQDEEATSEMGYHYGPNFSRV